MDTTSNHPSKNASTDPSNDGRSNTIFMSIDHLKKGTYSLSILEKKKVIKSIKIKKQ